MALCGIPVNDASTSNVLRLMLNGSVAPPVSSGTASKRTYSTASNSRVKSLRLL